MHYETNYPPPKKDLHGFEKPFADGRANDLGEPQGYFRAVMFEEGSLIEMQMSEVGFLRTMVKSMQNDPGFAALLQSSVRSFELMKSPIGAAILGPLLSSNPADICPCDKCRARRGETAAEAEDETDTVDAKLKAFFAGMTPKMGGPKA